MMKKVLLLNPPGKKLYLRDQHCGSISKSYYYWPPIDLLILSGILSAGYELEVIDAIIEKSDEKRTLERILLFHPDFIIFITSFVSWTHDLDFMRKVKESINVRMIASGGILRTNYESVMNRYEFLDAVLFDFTSNHIKSYLENNLDDLHDMCYRADERIVKTSNSDEKQFDLPVPRHDLFQIKKYRLPHAKKNPFTSVLTNYGCPYSCIYCIAECIDFKYRSVENVMDELHFITSLGIKEIFFKDFTFGIPRQIAEGLCIRISAELPKLSWICSSRVDVLDEKMLRLMKNAGCHTIQFGVESASQYLLDEIHKSIDISKIEETFEICRKLKIRTLAHFILGLPGETEDSLRRTIAFSKKIECEFAAFNIYMPIIGTSLRSKCMDNHWIIDETEEFDPSRGYPLVETSELSREKLWEFRNIALKEFYLRPGYILKKLKGIRSLHDFKVDVREGFELVKSIKF